MTTSKFRGKAQTVLGLVDAEDLGIILPHEHLFVDNTCFFKEPTNPEEREICYQKLSLDNLWYVKRNIFSNSDNMVLDDEKMAIDEVNYFKKANGKTIVDVTPIGMGWNPQGLVNVSKATGVNIMMGIGYYVASTYKPEMRIEKKSEEDIAEEFMKAIRDGVGETGIKAGIIGEVGCSWPLENGEIKVLRAAGMAQIETGASITIHTGPDENSPFECIKVLQSVGTDISRVSFGHVERAFSPDAFGPRSRLAEKGCCLVYDWFGREGVYPVSVISKKPPINDLTRINQIKELIKEGFLNQIMVSHDVCYKVMLRKFGGSGFDYIPTMTVKQMLDSAMTEKQINTIMIDNPSRMISFA